MASFVISHSISNAEPGDAFIELGETPVVFNDSILAFIKSSFKPII